MPELKRNFSQAKMNKDMDERLVPQGQYRDALNIQIATSDDSNVGAAQNLKGNVIRNNMATEYDNQVLDKATGLAPSMASNAVYALPIFVPDTSAVDLTNPYLNVTGDILPANLGLASLAVGRNDARWVGTGTCVGSIAVTDKDKIYYMVAAGDINEYHGYNVSNAASTRTSLESFGIPRKDYILEYDTITETIKYVFVDIYHVQRVNTTSAVGAVFIDEQPNPGSTTTYTAASTVNVHGVRPGMVIYGTFNGKDTSIEDRVTVTDLVHLPGIGWQIFLNKQITINAGDIVNFHAPRVLNFNKDIIITAINVIDDMLFWTDNHTEPKKINIKRSKAGTGGVEYLFTNLPTTNAGHSNYGAGNIVGGNPNAIFDGDTNYFHTRLVTEKPTDRKLQIETTDSNTKVVYTTEDHITAIRKAPTQPLELEMSRTRNPRINASGGINSSTATTTFSFTDTAGILLEAGAEFPIDFDTPVDYREGDIIILTYVLGNETAESFDDYEIMAEVTSSSVTGPNALATTGFVIKIMTIESSTPATSTFFYVRLQDEDPLFEFKFVRFSYRYRYADGEYSAFAPFSQVAFLPDTFEYLPKKGFNLGMRNQLRSLKLTKYFTDPIVGAVPEDVVEIDLLYKETNNPTVYTVKTLRPIDGEDMWPDFNDPNNILKRGEYEIKTDLIHAVVPSNQLLRPYDNLPRKALGQEVSGSRIIYANYLQNYDVEDPKIELALHQDSLSELDTDYALPSVKSIRTYQIGVVYSDEYGRETPVLTSKDASISVPKTASTTRNRINARLGLNTNVPAWAKYFSWYIKETSTEYYTLAMDRWYNAEDGNIWITFPSSERNKLDEETFLILKKAHGEETPVYERARYKILAIQNEPPDFIITERKKLGSQIFVGTAPSPQQESIQAGTNIDFSDNFGAKMLTNTPDSLFVKFIGPTQETDEYEVTNIFDDGGIVKLMLKRPMGQDVAFCSGVASGQLKIQLFEHEIETNRPQFGGKFFVKIHRDATLEKYVLRTSITSEQLVPTLSSKLYYLNNNFDTQPLGYGSYQKGRYGEAASGSLAAGPTLPTGNDAPSIHPYNKGTTTGFVSDYDHHPSYTWGTNGGGFGVSAADLTNTNLTEGPTHFINYNETSGRKFWEGVSARINSQAIANMSPDFGFFIDACSAYAFTGGGDNSNTNPKQPDQFPNPLDDGQHYSHDANANDIANYSPGVLNYAPAGITSNMNDGLGQISRGVWNGGEYIDISRLLSGGWSPNTAVTVGSFNHTIQNFGGPPTLVDAANFINALCTPGTQFKFERDPVGTVYTVQTYDGYSNHPHGAVYNGGAQNFVPGTPEQAGSWGIRNYKTEGPNSLVADQEQYEGTNMRQRWTIKVNPAIGSGPSGYSPDKGTSRAWDNTGGTSVAGLYHDMSPDSFDTIQILELKQSVIDISEGTNSPAVWETEPKEAVDLDIYYQASGLIPLKLTEKTNEEYLPIGTTFLTATSPNTVHTITSWDESNDGQTFNFTPAIPANINLADGDDVFFTKRDYYSLQGTVDTSTATQNISVTTSTTNPVTGVVTTTTTNTPVFGSGSTKMTLHGYRQTGWHYNKMFRRYHVLDWNNCWCFGNGVESDRIRDDFNAQQMDNGVKASTVLAEPVKEERREHGLIYSGIYNSISGVNNLNQFIAAEKITKELNPVYGSIQKLYTRDTNLVTLCEDKVLKILSNGKDALFNADGSTNVVSTEKVLGAAVPYQGDYGISTNPESFAATPGALYFVDQMRGAVLSMFGDNHVRPISQTGMTDYFTDSLKNRTDEGFWNILGSYDERKSEFNVTPMYKYYRHLDVADKATVSYSEKIKGWTSFKSYKPEHGISLNNDYYTFHGGEIYKHHQDDVDYNRFYDVPYESTFTLTFNDMPEAVKSFNTVNYEGTQAKVDEFISATTTDAAGNTLTDINDNEYFNLTSKTGWYVNSISTNKQTGDVIDFKEKEGKWFGAVSGDATDGIIFGSDTYNLDQSEFSVQGLGNATFKYKEGGGGTGYTGPAQVIIRNMPEQDDPLFGATNYTSSAGWDVTPDNTFLNSSLPYTVWRPEGGTSGVTYGYPVTINTQIGDVIPAGVAYFKLSPRAALQSLNPSLGPLYGGGTHFGYQLRAEDFSLGGGTLVVSTPLQVVTSWYGFTGTTQLFSYTWQPGNATTTAAGPLGLGSPNVTKVVMYDIHPGSTDNKVQVEVHYDSFTVSDPIEYINIDIDHVLPVELQNPRSVEVCVAYPYSSNQETPVATVIPNITKTIKQQGTREQ
jgi:hypothetical protein